MLNAGVNLKQLDASYQFSSAQFVSAPFSSILQNVPATLRSFNLDPSGAQYAAFTEVRWQLFQNVTLDFGLRWDQQNYTTATDDQQYSPRFSVLYRADQRTELRLGWGQYYQAQEINELPVSDGIADYFPAQRAEHLVARLEHSMTGDIDFNLSLYRKTFRSLRPRFENSFNTLTLLPELQFDRVRIAAPEAEAIGAEVALIRNGADDAVFWWLSYGWSSVQDKVAGEKLQRSWDQTQTLKAGINWSLGDWNLSLAGEVHSGWPTTSLTGQLVSTAGGDDELVLMVGAPNSTSYSTYHTLDARVSRDFSVGQGNLNVFLEISNLYNRDNACCVEYSLAADGNLVGQERNWLPLVPNLGVVWRF
jgi:outer membrane receptor protein involved in Fe transport